MASSDSMDKMAERIKLLEDQHSIYQLISAYGPAADSCNMVDIKRIWSEDCTYQIGGLGVFHGHDGIQDALDGDFHQELVRNGSAHVSSFPHVVIAGDHATATHYGTLYTHRDGGFLCLRVIASRWEFERSLGKDWQIKRRTNVLLDGNPDARAILAQTMQGPGQSGGTDRLAQA